MSRSRAQPVVIAHRGASAYRPEHTLAAYELAIALGADFVEPDLVATRDHRLVARHENEISATTDVAAHPEFADRRRTTVLDGAERTGWFTEDFTLAELKTLRARERIPELRPANAVLDGRSEIPTFEEVADLARRTGVGVYPETKHPAHFRALGLPLEEPLAAALERRGLARRSSPVFLQSFDPDSLRRLAALVDAPRIQLVGPGAGCADLTPAGLRAIAGYADGLGPHKDQVASAEGPATLVADAHAAGLLVHPYTFRPENAFLPGDLRRGDPEHPDFARARGDTAGELRRFFELGVDGVFADHADTAVAARHAWARGRR
jgi:glycerophosphoryl diester phosphodiesterase